MEDLLAGLKDTNCLLVLFCKKRDTAPESTFVLDIFLVLVC